MKLFPRTLLKILVVSFILNFGVTSKSYADDTLDTIVNTLQNLTCETQGVGDLLRTEFSQTCIVAPFFTFAIMNIVSPVLYMNTFLKLRINDNELFGTQFPGGQCTRANRVDPNDLKLTFGLCSNLKLAGVRAKAVVDSALAIAKAVLTGNDPWDDIKEAWKKNKADYYNIYTQKPEDSGTMWDLGVPIFWKVVQDNDRICVGTYGFTGVVPVGCKYIKEPFPKSMYNSFMDVNDTNFIDDPNNKAVDPLALVSCSAAGGGCYQKAYNASRTAVVMTSPLIECIRQMIARLLISEDVCSFDDVNAVVNSASRQTSALFQFQVGMYRIVTSFLTLYVMLFGAKILLAGQVPPKNEYINFILKIIFVTYFSIGLNITPGSTSPYDRMDGMIQWAFPFLLNGINGLASWVMNAAPYGLCKFNGPDISYDNSVAYIALWDALDCRVAHYLGLDMLSTLLVENTYKSHNFANFDFFSFSAPPYIYLLIPAIISGNMMLVSLALAYPLLVISVAAFMVNATVMCMVSIVILGILAPLFVPMFLFDYTRNYFDSWVKLMISFLLQPMVVVTFMITMFSVYDFGFYGKCQYESKLIHNSIEGALQGQTFKRDVLVFFVDNDWTKYSKEDAESCQNSLGYMLNNPISTAFNFAKDSVEQIVGSKPNQTCDPKAADADTKCNPKPGDSSTSSFLSKFQFLSGVILGPGMFFVSPKLLFEKIKDILLALVTACFTLYLMYNFSSQLANFAADMTEGVALSSVAIKPQAVFKAAMAALAAAGNATKGLDQFATKGGGGGDLLSTKGGRAGDLVKGSGGGGGSEGGDSFTSGGLREPSSTAATPSSALSSVGKSVGGTATPSSASEEMLDTSFSNRKPIEAPVSQPTTVSTQIDTAIKTEPPKVSAAEVVRNTAEDKLEDLSSKLNVTKEIKEAVPEPQKEEPKEPRVKHTTEVEPELNLDENLGVTRTIRGLDKDRKFTEQESHELKIGEAGYVKQEMRNAQIRDRRAAFEKETEELYRSRGGRAKDKATERNDGTIENRSKKIDSGSDENP